MQAGGLLIIACEHDPAEEVRTISELDRNCYSERKDDKAIKGSRIADEERNI